MNKSKTIFNIYIDPLRIESRQSTEKYNISDKSVLETVNYIDNNITSNLTIDELVSKVSLSRRNLEIKFKKEMGTSIYQFILDNKIKYISNELLTTDKDLLDIALEVGYNDVRNVYRIFKSYTGHTPADFRKNHDQNK